MISKENMGKISRWLHLLDLVESEILPLAWAMKVISEIKA